MMRTAVTVFSTAVALVSIGIVVNVHQKQTLDKQKMREGVYKDQERLKQKLAARESNKQEDKQ
jgi:hypothetical protein